MAAIFKKKKPYKNGGQNHRSRVEKPRRPTSDKDLVDPILYVGELDPVKYPVLPPTKKEEKEIDVENPLNKR